MTALKLVHNNFQPEGKKDYINHLSQLEPKTGVLFSEFITLTITRKFSGRLHC